MYTLLCIPYFVLDDADWAVAKTEKK